MELGQAGTSACARDTLGPNAIYTHTGLIHPIAVCLIAVVVGGLWIREIKDHKIDTPIRLRREQSARTRPPLQ